jgi:hemerythrin-like domain-containing protein
VLEAMEEHHLVDDIVEHHIEEEETELFEIARQVFSREELDALGSRLEATRAEQMQDPLPERDQIEL